MFRKKTSSIETNTYIVKWAFVFQKNLPYHCQCKYYKTMALKKHAKEEHIGLICNSMVCCRQETIIVLGCTSHYYKFPACITGTINSKYYSNPYYYVHILIMVVCTGGRTPQLQIIRISYLCIVWQ